MRDVPPATKINAKQYYGINPNKKKIIELNRNNSLRVASSGETDCSAWKLSANCVINEDETLQSSSMIVYGKVIIYHGLIIPLIEKRLGRLLCTTNDQLPTPDYRLDMLDRSH